MKCIIKYILLSIEKFIVILETWNYIVHDSRLKKYYMLFGRSISSSFTLIHILFCETL